MMTKSITTKMSVSSSMTLLAEPRGITRLRSALKMLTCRIAATRQRKVVYQHLSGLSDHLLRDIGIDRSEIDTLSDSTASTAIPSYGLILKEFGLVILDFFRPVIVFYRARQIERKLAELDDRMLKDIGINRAEIPSVAQRVATGDLAAPKNDIATADNVWVLSRKTAKSLRALDDQTLQDIGILRGDIDRISMQLALDSVRAANGNETSRAA